MVQTKKSSCKLVVFFVIYDCQTQIQFFKKSYAKALDIKKGPYSNMGNNSGI